MNYENRPIIKISLRPYDKIIEFISWVLLIIFWSFTLFNYTTLPEIIPTHFNGLGKVDGHGESWIILTLPFISTAIAIGLTILNNYPHKLNYTTTITPENAQKNYTIATRLMRFLKLIIIFVFFYIHSKTIQIASGIVKDAGQWFLLTIFALVFGWLFYFLISISNKQ